MKRTTRTHHEEPTQQEQQLSQSPEDNLGCLLRIYWMMLGNVFVAIAAYKIVQSEGELAIVDLVYWLFVVSLIMVRYVDIRLLRGCTSEGQPATMRDWQGYSLRVLAISATLWLVAHGLSYLMH
jgi:hypothetical protein